MSFNPMTFILSSFPVSQTPQKTEEDEALKAEREANPERTASGRVQRASAQVANFHLAEIANNELPKDWPKRKFQSDLVPDDKKARGEIHFIFYINTVKLLLLLLLNLFIPNKQTYEKGTMYASVLIKKTML